MERSYTPGSYQRKASKRHKLDLPDMRSKDAKEFENLITNVFGYQQAVYRIPLSGDISNHNRAKYFYDICYKNR